jgi:hypothetical protein
MSIFNLTQHAATPEQVQAGVIDPSPSVKAYVQELLTFATCPTRYEIRIRARTLAQIVVGDSVRATELAIQDGVEPIAPGQFKRAMIGGAPYLMPALDDVLFEHFSIEPLYSFSERVSEEVVQPDGSVRKVNTFRHAGWVEI